MTKHRLMLSAATAALLASPLLLAAARADTEVTTHTGTALATSTAGNILLDSTGSIDIKAAQAAVTVNSNNYLANNGSISNIDTSSAIGVLIDTSTGNIVAPTTGISNAGSVILSGTGSSKDAFVLSGGNTFFGNISLTAITTQSTNTTGQVTTTTGGTSVVVQGDSSSAFAFAYATTMDGDLTLGGPISMTPTKNSTATAGTLIDLEGNLNGNLIVSAGSQLVNVGSNARGLAVLGPVAACDASAMSAVGLTCASNSSGTIALAGAIQTIGTTTPNTKGGNLEGGSALVIGANVAGGLLIDGPKTAAASVTASTLVGSGATISGSTNAVVLIDPGQASLATNLGLLAPIIMGPVQSALDPADGISGQNGGYALINHGTIQAVPTDTDINATAIIIQGQSATDFTCLSGSSSACVSSVGGQHVGGFLNTGTIVAQASTKENTTSTVNANAITIGQYATVPRIVVAGEALGGSSTTPGVIEAVVTGPGGGGATAIAIAPLANVPEIDVLLRGTISATIQSSSPSPTSDFANAKTPFAEYSTAILDQSGTLTTINNAGTITANNTPLTPGTGAVTSNTEHAIDLLSNTQGGITINNSGTIEGDLYFGAAGGNDTLNVGNVTSGTGNTATGVTNTPYAYATVTGRILGTTTGFPPTVDSNIISFGTGSNQTLHVGAFGYVNSVILAQAGALNVTVDPNGQLYVANTSATGPLYAKNFDINGGVLGLSISQGTSSTTPVVQASQEATLSPNAQIGLQFGTFISSGTTAASVNAPTPQTITLISAPNGNLNISATTLAADNAKLAQNIPFLFESPNEAGSKAPQPLTLGSSSGNQTLLLTFLPRSPGATNADGTAGLGLSGDAYKMFPFVAKALENDPTLGAAIAGNLSVTNGVGVTTLNIAASQVKAQQVFSQFTPDVSGGTKAVAILITDQASGPVSSRQRLLRSYANQAGELTLWGEEFGGNINNKGRVDADGSLTAYKDHGWGFVMGMDAGSARNGWYGGALTYYSGDVSESLPRASLTHEQWYVLTGYSDWRGKHVFFDSKLDIGYGSLDGNRGMSIGGQTRDAIGKRAALLAAIGGTGGAFFNFGPLKLIPHISLDGLTMREEGYTEGSGGDGLDLQVAPYYANSLRVFLGNDFKTNVTLFGVGLTPEARLGYRYDFVGSPVKLKAGFVSTGGLAVPSNIMTFVGPDPDTGNILLGGSLTAGTDTWSLGVNYDWLRGNNASTTQVGMVTLLGRI